MLAGDYNSASQAINDAVVGQPDQDYYEIYAIIDIVAGNLESAQKNLDITKAFGVQGGFHAFLLQKLKEKNLLIDADYKLINPSAIAQNYKCQTFNS